MKKQCINCKHMVETENDDDITIVFCRHRLCETGYYNTCPDFRSTDVIVFDQMVWKTLDDMSEKIDPPTVTVEYADDAHTISMSDVYELLSTYPGIKFGITLDE